MAMFRKDTNSYLPQEKTIFEVVMIADQYGSVVGPANPSGTAVDAFGRARVSNPVTLFDSFHRYQDNGKIGTANSSGTTVTHDTNSSSVVCNVGTANNNYVYRESNRVFAYQPGKSLQIMQTFVMAPAQTGLRQRYGYFNADNGFFLEQDGHNIYFVKRSKSTGTVVETRIAKADWNIDTLDGSNTGPNPDGTPTSNRNPSGLTLDLSKAQILWHDVEWLGVGSVRVGFVINGKFIHCHTWNHANIVDITYMTTACLPVRCEIQNTANTSNTSNLRIICATVISEGGYQLSGKPRTVGQLPNSAYTMASVGTYYPVVAIRLKSETPDAIVIPKNISLMAKTGNGTTQKWAIVSDTTITGGSWTSAGTDSSVQYNITGTAMSGGNYLRSGYVYQAQQGTGAASLKDGEFILQLERNNFTNSNSTFVLAVTPGGNGDTCVGSIDWEEVT
jgi:hypothetical protein